MLGKMTGIHSSLGNCLLLRIARPGLIGVCFVLLPDTPCCPTKLTPLGINPPPPWVPSIPPPPEHLKTWLPVVPGPQCLSPFSVTSASTKMTLGPLGSWFLCLPLPSGVGRITGPEKTRPLWMCHPIVMQAGGVPGPRLGPPGPDKRLPGWAQDGSQTASRRWEQLNERRERAGTESVQQTLLC